MKYIIVYLSCLMLPLFSISQGLVNSETLQAVKLIRYGSEFGTCFGITVDQKDYFITAAHLFPGVSNKTTITYQIYNNGKWIVNTATFLHHKDFTVDIAVLDAHSSNIQVNSFDITGGQMVLSRECFFLGFPYGFASYDKGNFNNGFPVPLIKRGIVSGLINDPVGGLTLILDGINNPGFSGGPVLVAPFSNPEKNPMQLIGVVSGYKSERILVKNMESDTISKPGKKTNPKPLVEANTGLIVCYPSSLIVEIIKSNQ